MAPGNSFLLPIDVTPSAATGVAIANISASAANITLRLLDQTGAVVATGNPPQLNPLGGRQQIAKMIDELFPQLAGTTFRGSLVAALGTTASSNSLAVTALTVKEGLLSALPVIPFDLPQGGSTGGGSGSADVVFGLTIQGGGSLQFQGQTFVTAPPGGVVTFSNLPPGTYEITGAVGSVLIIGFANYGGVLGTGGVVPGSLQSLQSPPNVAPIISACSVHYGNVTLTPQPFRLRFTVTTSTAGACQTGL